MASKKKKLTPLQKEYNKQYKAYLKRIESAREAGFLIPEEHVKIKKEKPRRRDIESLKKVTRKSIQAEVKKGKLTILPIENLSMMREMNIAYNKDFTHVKVLKDIVQLYQRIAHKN